MMAMRENELDFNDYGKRVSLEMGLSVQLKLEGIGFPLQSSFVGMENDEFLIIKAPPQFTGIKYKMVPGVEIVVRYLYHGTVYGFQTKLIDVITQPARLLFLEYPKIIEHHDLRQQVRAHSLFPAVIRIKEHTNSGVIIDISKHGCRCHILQSRTEHLPPAQIDDEISLTCKFPGVEGDHEILGIIRNLKRSRKELIIGLQFTKIEYDLHEQIIRYIYAVEHYATPTQAG
jgi:c-di-GMP-binding flagellar brake protein YcgR